MAFPQTFASNMAYTQPARPILMPSYPIKSEYVFEVTKHGPILTDKAQSILKKAWVVGIDYRGDWSIVYTRVNNRTMKVFNQSIKNVPRALRAQLVIMGVNL